MKKILVIESCDSCPHFDNVYSEYNERCTELDRMIVRKDFSEPYPIPEDCPLKDAK